jgi:hypothetical protein
VMPITCLGDAPPIVCGITDGWEAIMRNIGITQSLKEQREFNRWLSSNTILGSILAIGMLAMALAGSNSAGRSDQAMAARPIVAATE